MPTAAERSTRHWPRCPMSAKGSRTTFNDQRPLGSMLSISFLDGKDGGAGAGVLAAVFASGLFIGMPELGGRNFPGYFGSGRVARLRWASRSPASQSRSAQVLTLVFCIDLEKLAQDRNISQERDFS